MTALPTSAREAAGSVRGLSVVVTGGSRGIGRAIAERFGHEGADVTIGSRRDPRLAGASWLPTDVADPAAADALIDAAVGSFGRIDVLVNNAGVQIERSIAETSDAEFDHIMNVNVRGVFNCSRAAVQRMRTEGGGAIINIGSVAGIVADHGMAVYNASKGAVHALTRSIAIDHGADGIRCNAISPGWIDTTMLDAAFEAMPDPVSARSEAIKKHPVGRFGDPRDIANLALWLAGPEAAFVSGSVFTIDGGLTAQNPIG